VAALPLSSTARYIYWHCLFLPTHCSKILLHIHTAFVTYKGL